MEKSIKKNVLFLGVGLYNYDTLLYNEMSKKFNVSYIYLVPVKKIPKWKYSLLSHLGCHNHLRKTNSDILLAELQKVKDIKFDFVFVIKGSRIESVHMDFINNNFSKAKKILYLWDSWSLIENKQVLLSGFEHIYSFDSEDCKKYDFKLRPLFYTNNGYNSTDKYYDVSFIGTDHSDRLEKLRSFRDMCLKNKFTYFLRLRTTGYPLFCARFNRGRYKKDDLEILTSEFMTYDEVMDVTRKSRVVIDFAHPVQCGLTIRTLESLAMGCKLITSNKYIKEYKDIPSDSYCIIDEENEKSIISFLKGETNNFTLPSSYSLHSFLDNLIQ